MDGTFLAIAISVSFLLVFSSLGSTLVYQFHYGPEARLRKRVKVILDPEGAAGGGKADKAGASQRRAIQAKLKELEAAGKASKRFVLRQKILQAGLTMPVSRFYLVNVAVGIAGGVAFAIFKPDLYYIAPVVAVPVGFFLPTYVLGILAKSTLDRLRNE